MSGRINPGGHGWTKDVAPPKPGSRPKGLPPKPKEKILMEASQSGDQAQQDERFTREHAEEQTRQEESQPQGDGVHDTPQDDPAPSESEQRAQAEASGTEQAPNPAQDSQQEPTQDSNLQTPQPDQAVPSEAERDAARQAAGAQDASAPGDSTPAPSGTGGTTGGTTGDVTGGTTGGVTP